MFHKPSRINGVKGVIALLAVMIAPGAMATPILFISDGLNSVTASDLNGDGVVQYTGSVGSFDLVVAVGTTTPALGSPDKPEMSLLNIDLNGADAGTLTIRFSETDFTAPGPFELAGLLNGTSIGGTVTYSAYRDLGNASLGTSELIARVMKSTIKAAFSRMRSATSPSSSLLQMPSPIAIAP